MLLYPNMLRRLLETFLAFKSPASVGDFTGAMRGSGETLKASHHRRRFYIHKCHRQASFRGTLRSSRRGAF
jgi:hypothetical protein